MRMSYAKGGHVASPRFRRLIENFNPHTQAHTHKYTPTHTQSKSAYIYKSSVESFTTTKNYGKFVNSLVFFLIKLNIYLF